MTSDYDREKLQERLAKLAGGVAILRVGGATEVEVKERKDRVDDAVHATRAAVEEGVVPGGGVALLYGIKALTRLKPDNSDQKVGIDIVRRALSYPTRLIAENAGANSSMIVGKLLEQGDVNHGFDAQTGTYTDMVKAGIIDPTKVVRLALQGAASVAALLITTEAMVGEKRDGQERSLPVGGGMGDGGILGAAAKEPQRLSGPKPEPGQVAPCAVQSALAYHGARGVHGIASGHRRMRRGVGCRPEHRQLERHDVEQASNRRGGWTADRRPGSSAADQRCGWGGTG